MIDLNHNVPPPTPPSKFSVPGIGIIVLVCIAAFVGGVFATNLWESLREDEPEMEDTYPVVEEDVEEEEEMEEDEDTVPPEYIDDPQALTIDWLEPTQQPAVADDPAFGEVLCFDVVEGEEFNQCEENPGDWTSWSYKLGSVDGGTYDGYDLVMTTVPMAGMGINYVSFYVLKDPANEKKPVLLNILREVGSFGSSTTQNTLGDYYTDRFKNLSGYIIDTGATIAEFEFDTELRNETTGDEFIFTGYWLRLYSEEAISLTGASTSVNLGDMSLWLYEPKRDVSEMILEGQTGVGQNQFYTVDEDGRVLFYDLKVPFFAYDQDKEGNVLSYGIGTPNIRWSDGTTNEMVYYKGAIGGCGFMTATNVVDEETIDELAAPEGFVQVGSGVDGATTYPIYAPSSYENEYYADAFNIVTWEADEEEKTYEDFSHPYVYYQDSFDRWVEFMSQEIVPPVECGKPVIYLYPESKMDMSVWVSPRGGFSYTEPEYGDGWDVTAYPDGRIVNREDGLTYPYLFWEGRGGLYSPVETYWVVEQPRVESFLRETLAKMNFNQNETADFVEFWLPRMQEAAYYKIGFHGTNVMNELAPLSLSVKPDHIFRILMDYEELDAWQPSKPPVRLPRANRDGFEVMEWGGVLR